MGFRVALLLLASHWLCAQTLSLPGCDEPASLRQILRQQLATEKLATMEFTARVAFSRHLLESLIAQYPREIEPYRRIIQSTKEDAPDRYLELISHFQERAELHPEDPLALYVAGLALSGTNTPLSIQFLEQSRSLAPAFSWPALELARIYAPGTKRADAAKAASEITAFFDACPSSADPVAQLQLVRSGTNALQLLAASALRARLAAETNIYVLKEYATLWSLEFRVHSPAEYALLRTQVSADLSRLARLNPQSDADFLVFLKDGVKLSGASPGAVASAEDRIIQKSPHSDRAYEITRERWESTHQEPQSNADATAWAAYHRAYRAALKTWLAQFTDSPELQHTEAFQATLYDPDMPEQDGHRAVDDYLTYISEYRRPTVNDLLTITWVLVDHNWEPSRVFTLLHDSDKLIQGWGIKMLPPAAALRYPAETGWHLPARKMPAFELTDLAGKTWRLKDLSGRVVLINVWATWCGPCQRELPHIQSLYSKLKNREDVQILTLSIDEDPGILPVYLSAKGYTFPVLPADGFVTRLLDMVAIPQSWIVDPTGRWRWTGAPNTTDADWEAAVLRQLDSVK